MMRTPQQESKATNWCMRDVHVAVDMTLEVEKD